MSGENITRMSLAEANLHKGETDWEWLEKQDAAGVEPEVDPEEGEVDWSQARIVMPPSKQIISVRIDRDVLAFFKSQGTRVSDAYQCGPAQLHGSEAGPSPRQIVSTEPNSRAKLTQAKVAQSCLQPLQDISQRGFCARRRHNDGLSEPGCGSPWCPDGKTRTFNPKFQTFNSKTAVRLCPGYG